MSLSWHDNRELEADRERRAELAERRARFEPVSFESALMPTKEQSMEISRLASDRSHIKDFLGVHAHWEGERGKRIKDYLRQQLAEVEKELEEATDEKE